MFIVHLVSFSLRERMYLRVFRYSWPRLYGILVSFLANPGTSEPSGSWQALRPPIPSDVTQGEDNLTLWRQLC